MKNSLVDFLIAHNAKQSELFTSPDEEGARRLYRAEHPTEICALKCMDGRLNIALMTETPPGIVQPFRNIGGKFDIGWPYFGQVMDSWINYAIGRGRRCLALVTYHYSKGDHHRGCAGHAYDTDAAREFAFGLLAQIERVFGTRHAVVHPIVVGVETDEDALILHGRKGEILNLADEPGLTGEELRGRVERLHPDMQPQVVSDLLPLLEGNLRHIAQVRKTKRPITEIVHKEQVLAVGRGFDWLHLPNKALIVGPYSYNLGEPIATAGKLLLGNLKDGRISAEDGVVLLSSAVYRDDVGFEKFRAVEKAKSLAQFSLDTLRERVPELLPSLRVLAGTVNQNTRFFTRVPFDAS